jgi:hypothetical protein
MWEKERRTHRDSEGGILFPDQWEITEIVEANSEGHDSELRVWILNEIKQIVQECLLGVLNKAVEFIEHKNHGQFGALGLLQHGL